MALTTVGVGSAANDGTGDPLRTAFQTVNAALNAANAGQMQGFKNRIINGSFDVWQRGTSFSGNTGQRYVADRFYTRSNSGLTSVVASRQTGDQARYCLRFGREDSTSGLGFTWATQNLEWANIIGLLGQQCTISFRARKGAGLSGTAQLGVRQSSSENPGMSSGGGFVSGDTVLLSQNLSLTTSWQTFSYQFTPTSAAKTLAVVFGWTPTGTATNDYIEIELLQVEPGAVATTFERRHIALEESLCHYYFQRLSSPAAYTQFGVGNASSSSAALALVRFRRAMRSPPTVTTSGNFALGRVAAAASLSSFSFIGNTSLDAALFSSTGSSGLVAGESVRLISDNNTSAYIDLNAEI